ncbi:MAG: four helix bundle protein [Treponema sp.]|nr:four helix bundle protein [Treponema sp.]
MALYYDLPVFKDVYQMTLRIFQVTTNFPREYKFTLGQDLKRDCILLVRYIYIANKIKDKTVYLEQFLDSFEVVKLELRLCKDFHLTTVKQQSEFAVYMDSIGKQITAWRNAGSNK